jgi:hypothetical protein
VKKDLLKVSVGVEVDRSRPESPPGHALSEVPGGGEGAAGDRGREA